MCRFLREKNKLGDFVFLNKRLFFKLQLQQGEKEMMKKLGLFAFVMALVVAFALPAFAYTVEGAKGERFTMGGVMSYDLGYRNVNKDYATVAAFGTYGGKDNTRFFTGLDYWSNIYALFNVGNASFFARFYVNSDVGSYNKLINDTLAYSGTEFQNQRDIVLLDTYYGSYKFGPMTLSAGKQEGSTVSWGMSQRLGYTPSGGGHVAGIAYGFVYDQKYPQLRIKHDISKIFAYQISLVQTGTYAEPLATTTAAGTTTTIINGTTTTIPTTATTGIRQSYADYPMIAAKVMLNFGMVQLNPAAAYQRVKWDNLQAGWDTDMTAWLARLPVKFIMGPFTAQGEMTYGQNLGAPSSNFANICSGEASFGGYQRINGQIKNANTWAGFLDLAFTFGPVTPHIYGGFTRSSNSDFYKVGDSDNTRTIYGINAYYTVTPNFLIIPEFLVSDLGTVPGVASKPKLGGDWLGGVNFSFFF